MFVKRLISAVVMIAGLIWLVQAGGTAIWVVVSIIAMAAFWELVRALGLTEKEKGMRSLVITGMILIAVMYGFAGFYDYKIALLLAPVLYVILLLAVYVIRYGKMSVTDVQKLTFGYVYAAVLIGFVPVVRDYFDNGVYLAWLFLITPIASDTFAYCVGSLIGKHKFAPVVSPKKSIEGSVGGLIGGAVCTGIYGYFMSTKIGGGVPLVVTCVILGLINGGLSQLGDLAASAIKREQGIKDYGNIIPGHGGALDRIDSILYVAPLVYIGAIIIENCIL